MKSFKQKGFILVTTLIFVSVLAIVLATLAKYGILSRKLNESQSNMIRGQLSAETAVEFAAAQIESRFMSTSTLTKDMLLNDQPEAPALTDFPDTMKVEEIEVLTGIVPTGEIEFIDPTDKDNEQDPLKGQRVLSRYLLIIGQSEVNGRKYSGKMRLQVRDANLFSYNVFFANDCSLAGSGTVTYNGHIYVGGEARIGETSGNASHTFLGTIVSADKVIVRENITNSGALYITTPGGTKKSLNNKTTGSARSDFLFNGNTPGWAKTFGDDWKTASTNFTKGAVMDSTHGINAFSPPALKNAAESFHQIIEAPIPLPTGQTPESYAAATAGHTQPYDPQIEAIKMGNKANLIIEVDVNYSNTTYFPNLEPNGWGQVSLAKNSVGQSTSSSHNIDTTTKALLAYDTNRTADTNTINVKAYVMQPDDNGEYVRDGQRYTRKDVTDDINATTVKVSGNYSANAIVKTKDSDNKPIKFWDARRRQWIHTADIDMEVLKEAVDSNIIPGWNGAVFVESKVNGQVLDQRVNSRTDGKRKFDQYPGIDTAVSQSTFNTYSRTGVRLVNGQAGNIPTTDEVEGFTIATNNHLYIKGHFNADGTVTTNATTAAAPDANEVPVAILADTVSVQSSNWEDRYSRINFNHNEKDGSNLEISAGIATGVMPEATSTGVASNSRSSDSMIRYMEDFSGRTYVHRGSVVNLWDSLVSPQAVVYSGSDSRNATHQVPQNRVIVFSDLFGEGAFPPESPRFRTFQRIHYRDIYEPEYDELKELIQSALTMSEEDFEEKLDYLRELYEK